VTNKTAPDLLIAALTDPGCDPAKAINEDAYLNAKRDNATLLVVCDGMGGHEGGRVASTTAIQVINSLFEAGMPDTGHSPISQATRRDGRARSTCTSQRARKPSANRAYLRRTACHHGGVAVAHVGDSRAYRVRGGVIER
jgi:protein phosphatase